MNKQFIQNITLKTGQVIKTLTQYTSTRDPMREQMTGTIYFRNDTFQCEWNEIRFIETVLNPSYDPTKEND